MTPQINGGHEMLKEPVTLSIDIGGTKLKACTVDASGAMLASPVIASTPRPSPPNAVLHTLEGMVMGLGDFQRVSVGFPGVVRGPRVITAPNLGTQDWANFDFAKALSSTFGVPVRILNDAAVQGLGVVRGPGLETVITLGTGVGCAVYRDRCWLLHLELALDAYIGNEVLNTAGADAWNDRLRKAVADVIRLTACERLYIGGGNARKVAVELPKNVELVSNTAGLTGGVRLWEPAFDRHFGPVPTIDRSSCRDPE